MHPPSTSVRALLGSLGLLTGLAACGSAGGGPTGNTVPPPCGNAANCNPVDASGDAPPNLVPDAGSDASPSDAADETYVPPCGNAAVCDSGSGPSDASSEATVDASVDAGGFDGHFGCGTGNGPVCPPDASE
jgi:hypothetical protein